MVRTNDLEAFWEDELSSYLALSAARLEADSTRAGGCSGIYVECLWVKLTWPWFDLNCCAAPNVLLHLRHALSGRLVRVVGGTNCDLVLNAALALQVIPALPVQRRRKKKRFRQYKLTNSLAQLNWLSVKWKHADFLICMLFLVSVKQLYLWRMEHKSSSFDQTLTLAFHLTLIVFSFKTPLTVAGFNLRTRHVHSNFYL